MSVAERVLKSLSNPGGKWRLVVVQREDGNFTYRMQMLAGLIWGPSGMDAGVYDTAETAEHEARAKLSEGKFPDTLVWTPEITSP
jgi:hypothetical protein